MNDILTYADLDRALVALGFSRQEFEGKHYVYVHEPSDTLITFPIVEMQIQARPAHLLTARKMVIERGVAEEAAWNLLLNDRSKYKAAELSENISIMRCLSYRELEQTLARLGFTKRITVNGHIHFEHPSGAVLRRAYTPDETAREIVVVAARSTIADWGVADQETFERLLTESAEQAGVPSPAAA